MYQLPVLIAVGAWAMSMFICWCVQLGGIVTPNDGHCHLDRGGLYTESLNQVLLYLLLSKSDEYCQHFSAVDLLRI